MNLFALVKQSPDCAALLGEGVTRFFEFGTAPQLETLPYATWQQTGGDTFNQLAGPAEADHVTLQIDVWAETPSAARSITDAIRRAIEGAGYITFMQQGRDEVSSLYRCTFHFQYIDVR